MKNNEARRELLEKYEHHCNFITGFHAEIKTKCDSCGKVFWINIMHLPTVLLNEQVCQCFHCGKLTLRLVPIQKMTP